MNAVLSILPDKAWFVLLVVFTVGALELFGKRLERGETRGRKTIASTLLLAFVALVAIGVLEFSGAGAFTFRSLSMFLTGAAGLGILVGLLLTVRGASRSAEERRMLARDL
jgi:hypothetical protein